MADPTHGPNEPQRSDRGTLGLAVAVLNALGSVWIIALMGLIVADITMRTAFNAPIPGTTELVAFSIVGIVFLQLSHTLRTGNLTRTDMVLTFLAAHAPRAYRLLLAAFDLCGAALLVIALWLFVPNLEAAWSQPERYFMGNPGFFTVPLWPLYALMAVGIAATILQFAASAVQVLRGGRA